MVTAAPERFESYVGGCRKVHQEQSHSLPGELRGKKWQGHGCDFHCENKVRMASTCWHQGTPHQVL